MRLIDADTIKQRIIAFCTGCNTTYLTVENIVMLINRADTVDAVPVVRCRGCKFYFPDSTNPCVLSIGLTMVDEDDFCSYGEGNEDENGRT